MKKILLISCLALYGIGSASADQTAPASATSSVEAAGDPELTGDRGYYFGYTFGGTLLQSGNIDVDLQQVIQGLTDAMSGTEPRLNQQQQQAVITVIRNRQQTVRSEQQAAEEMKSMESLEQAVAFLEQNKSKPNIITTASGLQLEHLVKGTGPSPKEKDTVTVHYDGKFLNGNSFDSSYDRGEAAEFRLDRVVAGWTEGLQLMQEGGKARLYLHPDLGYGPGGRPGIPGNSLLIFDVELLDVVIGD